MEKKNQNVKAAARPLKLYVTNGKTWIGDDFGNPVCEVLGDKVENAKCLLAINEHAALVAVAEVAKHCVIAEFGTFKAAEKWAAQTSGDTYWHKIIANLAAVRGE